MSEKKPFDAAIKYLRQRLLGFPKRGLWSISDEYKQECLDMEAAIHFLEVAGKVDKESCHLWLNHCFVSIEKTPEKDMKKMMEWAQTKSPSPKEQLSAMVEALPGKEKKCIGTY